MNSELREQVSAFVDGELDSDEAALLVRRLARDSELRDYAATLMDMGRLMRGETLSAGDGFLDRFHAALEGSDVAGATDVPQSDGYRVAANGSASSGWWRMAGGGALSLGVAALALNWMGGQPVETSPVLAEQTTVAPVRNAAAEAGVDYVTPTEVSSSGLVIADPQLAAYYLNHAISRRALAPGAGGSTMLDPATAEELSPADADAETDTEAEGAYQ